MPPPQKLWHKNRTNIIVGVIGVMVRSPSPDPFHQDDPYLAILEFLIILSAVALVSMMAAVYGCTPPSTKTYSLVSLAFTIVLAVLTSSVHFASLTVGRQIEFRLGREAVVHLWMIPPRE